MNCATFGFWLWEFSQRGYVTSGVPADCSFVAEVLNMKNPSVFIQFLTNVLCISFVVNPSYLRKYGNISRSCNYHSPLFRIHIHSTISQKHHPSFLRQKNYQICHHERKQSRNLPYTAHRAPPCHRMRSTNMRNRVPKRVKHLQTGYPRPAPTTPPSLCPLEPKKKREGERDNKFQHALTKKTPISAPNFFAA